MTTIDPAFDRLFPLIAEHDDALKAERDDPALSDDDRRQAALMIKALYRGASSALGDARNAIADMELQARRARESDPVGEIQTPEEYERYGRAMALDYLCGALSNLIMTADQRDVRHGSSPIADDHAG